MVQSNTVRELSIGVLVYLYIKSEQFSNDYCVHLPREYKLENECKIVAVQKNKRKQ